MSDFLLLEGFDAYPSVNAADGGLQSKWTIGGSGTFNLAAGRFAGQCMRLYDATGSTRFARRNLPALAGPNFCIGFAYRCGDAPGIGTQYIFYLDNVTTSQIRILQTGQKLNVTRNTTVLFTTGDILITNQWHYIELVGTLADTGGHVELWVDNVKVGEFSGDTNNVAGAQYNSILLLAPDNAGSGTIASFDDLYVNNGNVRLGEMRIDYSPVSGDTADKDFVPSTGSTNWNLLDEVPIVSTDYVTGAVVTDKDLYEIADITDDGGQVFAVQAMISALKTDAGTREFDVLLVAGASTVNTRQVPVTTPYIHEGEILENNPATSAPWTFSGLNGVKVGQEVMV